ncbi:Endonuclease V [Musa troglodytarum]|uniref:Endonuclease V n=1 Tax=Musa troglodytarum TaxID=320322 RepID=A0A9E7I534_9LILI|nr:Endonuclease V [Musa troglodytarum]
MWFGALPRAGRASPRKKTGFPRQALVEVLIKGMNEAPHVSCSCYSCRQHDHTCSGGIEKPQDEGEEAGTQNIGDEVERREWRKNYHMESMASPMESGHSLGFRDDLLARRAQESLKEKLVLEDDFAWGVPSHGLASGDGSRREKLKYIGGVDISFLKKDPSVSCGALVVLDADTMDVVHEEFEVTRLQVPYVPGFLAFREASMLLGLLNKMKANAHPFYPQLVMVDGNGLLHPRGHMGSEL